MREEDGKKKQLTSGVEGYFKILLTIFIRLDAEPGRHELADPRQILVEGSDGASDYGNK